MQQKNDDQLLEVIRAVVCVDRGEFLTKEEVDLAANYLLPFVRREIKRHNGQGK